ncbi:acid phosphatase [Phellopilus nigrolimitatus]|nr:acid phosphatase [Phellopilus nigrolimitatus]
MHAPAAALLFFVSLAHAQTKVVISNDDGWAAANIRAQYDALISEGYNIVLSAPAENGSGTGSLDVPPTPVLSGCEFDSCPPLSPATGHNASDARLNYVNSFPVTSVKYGIQTFGRRFFNGTKPDLVVSGPNVGTNSGLINLFSGTIGVATEATKEGIPAVAFSGAFSTQTGYTTLSAPSDSTTAATIYAALGAKFLAALLAPGINASAPILPAGVMVSVNYPNATGACADADAYRFVLARAVDATIFTAKDVSTCGSTRLPTEAAVLAMGGCFASVSTLSAATKLDADAAAQAYVLQKVGALLTCVESGVGKELMFTANRYDLRAAFSKRYGTHLHLISFWDACGVC